jgi:TPR repeat protein
MIYSIHPGRLTIIAIFTVVFLGTFPQACVAQEPGFGVGYIFYPEDSPDAQYLLALEALEDEDYAQALELFSALAEHGWGQARTAMAWMYIEGVGVVADPVTAAELLQPHGMLPLGADAVAYHNLGMMYLHGIGVEQDDRIAFLLLEFAMDRSSWELEQDTENPWPLSQANPAFLCFLDATCETPYPRTLEGLLQSATDNYDALLEQFRAEATNGDIEMQRYLGRMYLSGSSDRQDEAEGFRWYLMAAELGDAEAQCEVGLLRFEGQGCEQDNAAAFEWFSRAAEQEHPYAQYCVGRLYYRGLGVEQNLGEALRCYNLAANLGSPQALYRIGEMYDQGEGLPQDPVQAAAYFRAAAQQGLRAAEYRLAMCYYVGHGVPQNWGHAAAWADAATSGPFLMREDGEAHDNALRLLDQLADAGIPRAQYAVGLRLVGHSSEEKHAEGMRLLQAAADQGADYAQYQLGLFFTGSFADIEQDLEVSAQWFTLAADQGHAYAQYHLGVMYSHGQGVERDIARGYMWLSLAIEGLLDTDTLESGQEVLATLAAEMTPEQLEQAEELIDQWRAGHVDAEPNTD